MPSSEIWNHSKHRSVRKMRRLHNFGDTAGSRRALLGLLEVVLEQQVAGLVPRVECRQRHRQASLAISRGTDRNIRTRKRRLDQRLVGRNQGNEMQK